MTEIVTILYLCLSPLLINCYATPIPWQGQVQYVTGNDVCHTKVMGRINAPWPKESALYGFTSCSAITELQR